MTDELGKRRAAIALEARARQLAEAAQAAVRAVLEHAPGVSRVVVLIETDVPGSPKKERAFAGWPEAMGTHGMGEVLCGAGIALVDASTKEGE